MEKPSAPATGPPVAPEAVTTAFLSPENRTYVVGVLRGFLAQRYGLQVEDGRLLGLVAAAIGPIAQEHGRTEPLDVLNRRLLVAIKNTLTATPGAAPVPGMAPGPTPGVAPGPAPTPMAAPLVAAAPMGPEPEQPEETEESLFMRRVQQLEEVRRMPLPVAAAAAPTEAAAAGAVAPMADEVTETKVAPPAPVATTVYVPAPTEYHQALCIHAWDREWDLYNERCLFPWNGPIPAILDRANLRLSALLLPLPRDVAAQSPYVRVSIEGAGRQRSDTLCIPDGGASGAGVVWRPCSKELSYIRAYSVPWTITLRGGSDEPLDLGLDGWKVTRAEMTGASGLVRVTLGHDSYPEEAQRLRQHFEPGEWVLFSLGGGPTRQKRLRVSAVYDAQRSLDLFLPLGEAGAATGGSGAATAGLEGASVLNLTRQPVLILEGSLKK